VHPSTGHWNCSGIVFPFGWLGFHGRYLLAQKGEGEHRYQHDDTPDSQCDDLESVAAVRQLLPRLQGSKDDVGPCEQLRNRRCGVGETFRVDHARLRRLIALTS
jgi:hypothetical protein